MPEQKNILIRLYHENGTLNLRIKDDGVGFNASTVSRGVGLINIQTRASLFNGTTEIISAPDQGTELVVVFPDSNSKKAVNGFLDNILACLAFCRWPCI